MEDLVGTRALPALQTSGKVRVAVTRDLGHNLLSFEALDASCILQQETYATLQCFHVGLCRFHASRMTLERYDVESCGESLIVHELSLVRSPGVFTLFLFVCKPEFLINSSECLGSASIFFLDMVFVLREIHNEDSKCTRQTSWNERHASKGRACY